MLTKPNNNIEMETPNPSLKMLFTAMLGAMGALLNDTYQWFNVKFTLLNIQSQTADAIIVAFCGAVAAAAGHSFWKWMILPGVRWSWKKVKAIRKSKPTINGNA